MSRSITRPAYADGSDVPPIFCSFKSLYVGMSPTPRGDFDHEGKTKRLIDGILLCTAVEPCDEIIERVKMPVEGWLAWRRSTVFDHVGVMLGFVSNPHQVHVQCVCHSGSPPNQSLRGREIVP